jgi:hypothetical protein
MRCDREFFARYLRKGLLLDAGDTKVEAPDACASGAAAAVERSRRHGDEHASGSAVPGGRPDPNQNCMESR